MLTRGELKGLVLRLLNKTSSFRGFYSDEKMNDAIQEAYDFIATEMFDANEGWQTKLQYFNTDSNQITVEIPQHVSMIREIRYKVGDVYIPLTYNDGSESVSAGDKANAGVTQYPSQYRIIDNALYFDPPLAEGGTEFLQIESTNYPNWLQDDQDRIDPHFDRSCVHFMKYKCATLLVKGAEKVYIPWRQEEGQWFEKMRKVLVKRINKPIRIREFGS